MYCPKCSQQQLSEELRFCSRCGFPLAGVALLLEHEGAIPWLLPKEQKPGHRRQIIKESALLTVGSWIVALFSTLWWDLGGSLESVAKAASLIFFLLGLIGLLRFIYAFLFVRERVAPTSPALPTPVRRSALPPPQDVPLTDYPRPITREMVPRGSVTENTTRLLDEE